MKYVSLFVFALLIVVFSACENSSDSSEVKLHWDRDMCTRCVMVISDRHNTVQVTNPKTSKNYMFDDIGCMALWFNDEKISWNDEAVVKITDADTGEWINAKDAFYDSQNITPMGFGYSAHKTKDSIKKDQEIIDYEEVLRRVLK